MYKVNEEKKELALIRDELRSLTKRVIKLHGLTDRNEWINNLAIAQNLPFKRKDLMTALGIKSHATLHNWLRDPTESLAEHKKKTTLLNYYFFVINHKPRFKKKFQEYILSLVEIQKEEVRRVLDQKVRLVVV